MRASLFALPALLALALGAAGCEGGGDAVSTAPAGDAAPPTNVAPAPQPAPLEPAPSEPLPEPAPAVGEPVPVDGGSEPIQPSVDVDPSAPRVPDAGIAPAGEAPVPGDAVARVAPIAPPAPTAVTAPEGITVSGTGEARVIPDAARLVVGVEANAATAGAALAEASRRATLVVDALRGAGVGDADLQTQELGVNPITSPDGTQVSGFRATNTITATVRRPERAGDVLDAAVDAGANQVQSVELLVTDPTRGYDEALSAAIAATRRKAEALAARAGAELGEIVALTESPTGPPPPIPLARSGDSASVELGRTTVTATVTVTFALS